MSAPAAWKISAIALDVLVEEPERRGVREHQPGASRVDLGGEVVEVDVAARVGVELDVSSKPVIVTLAGLVPWAVSGMTILCALSLAGRSK